MSRPRLVLYGLGQYGQMMVQLADKKGWPVVAAFNRAGEKVGKDIGRLAGLGRDYGVVVQDCDTAEYAGLSADIGIITMYDTLAVNEKAYERLLGAGLNVIDHGSEAYFPVSSDPAIAEKIDRLARQNGVTFTGTGVWDMSRIWAALLVAGVCDEIEHLHNHSLTILDPFGAKIVRMSGVGMTPEEFARTIAGPDSTFGGHIYRLAPQLVLKGLGYTVNGVSIRQEPVLSDQPVYCEILGEAVPAGRALGIRTVAEATSEEGVMASVSAESRIRFDADEREHSSWDVKGNVLSPSIRVERDSGHQMQALSVFNRITDVIAASPGLQLIPDLGAPMRHLASQ